MSEQIKLQQALFGYRDGHNLLATSTALAPRTRQFLATITDSSGPENTKGFEGAFTGLPVPETDFYALFRTWPAPEMPRPGCVWSHVILIQLADLARIPALFQLGNLCSRPSVPIDAARYEAPLSLDVTKSEESPAGKLDQMRLHCLVWALYEHPEVGVVILDEESASWEKAVFQVWAQQWPRLRREFAFSTGSLSDRRLAGIPFDLQIAPTSSERLWRRAGAQTLVLNFPASPLEPIGESFSHWFEIAEEDLNKASNRRFRQFLFEYGSDVEKPRASFSKLAAIYKQVRAVSDISWLELLRSVGDAFPVPTEAVRLKKSLVTLPEDLNPSEKLERAWSIITFLLDSQQSAAYPSLDFDFATIATSLWNEKREVTIALLCRLVRRDEQPAAVSFANSIANVVDAPSLRAIAQEQGELVPLVISHNPALAFEIETWRLNSYIQAQVFEILTKLPLSPMEWGKIVGAMCVAGSYLSVSDAVFRSGKYALDGVLSILANAGDDHALPNQAWRNALASTSSEALHHNLDLSVGQLALAAWCATPNDILSRLSVERHDVKRFAAEYRKILPICFRGHSAFLLITLGLCAPRDTGKQFVLENFYLVHNSLASDKYHLESWMLLACELPSIGFWRDWDKCKRLRKGVNKYLKSYGGSKQLEAYAREPDERNLALEVAESEFEDSNSEFID
jgi:hypothetical protein